MDSHPFSQGYKQKNYPTLEDRNTKPKSIQDQKNAHVSIIDLIFDIKQIKNLEQQTETY